MAEGAGGVQAGEGEARGSRAALYNHPKGDFNRMRVGLFSQVTRQEEMASSWIPLPGKSCQALRQTAWGTDGDAITRGCFKKPFDMALSAVA